MVYEEHSKNKPDGKGKEALVTTTVTHTADVCKHLQTPPAGHTNTHPRQTSEHLGKQWALLPLAQEHNQTQPSSACMARR